MRFRLVQNQSENVEYNLISVDLTNKNQRGIFVRIKGNDSAVYVNCENVQNDARLPDLE